MYANPASNYAGLTAAMVAALLLLGGGLGSHTGRGGTTSAGPVYHNDTYSSSIDGFPLSYSEWLPAGYNANDTYPLAIYLHGIGSSTNWVKGGTNLWMSELNTTTLNGETERALISNASANGFILIVINTRSESGFYANTPCGGPQEQDVLDAIHNEEHLRHIGSLYLIGFSMGSIGSFELAEQYPGMFAGVATAGTMTDFFEEYEYETNGRVPKSGPSYELNTNDCGLTPSRYNSTVVSTFENLSGRFGMSNLTVPLWVGAGGADNVAPDESHWYSAYQEANDSILVQTCANVSSLGEPGLCSGPFNGTLRFVFEPQATHSMAQLDPADIFAFFLGKTGGGQFTSSFPPKVLKQVP